MQTAGASIFIKKYQHYLFFAAIFAFVWLILNSSTREYLTSQEKKIKNTFKSAENVIKSGMKNYKKTGKKLSEKEMRKWGKIVKKFVFYKDK
jgi:hypothetical protein